MPSFFNHRTMKFYFVWGHLTGDLYARSHYNESPKHALYLSTGYDMEMVGQSYSYIDRDNFLMSYSDDYSPALSAQYVRRHKLRYVHEWPSRFSVDTWLQMTDNEVVGIDEAQFFDNGIVDVCTTLANNGCPIEHIQQMMGHAKIETTMIYTKLNQEEIRRNHERCAI